MKSPHLLLKIYAVIFLLMLAVAGKAGDLLSYIQNIAKFNRLYPQEKVYLHFDNTGYYLGETIWFKAYVVKADELIPTNLSRVLYVELLNSEGDVVETKKLKIENGQCHGDFRLQDSLFAGFYEVRAYTRYMLNFGNVDLADKKDSLKNGTGLIYDSIANCYLKQNNKEVEPIGSLPKILIPGNGCIVDSYPFYTQSFGGKNPFNSSIFSRVFPVYDKPDEEGAYAVRIMNKRRKQIDNESDFDNKHSEISLSFYPESGTLVNGIRTRVAFKVINSKGQNLNLKGVIRNSIGEKIENMQTTHDGMGCFQLTPDGNPYSAEIVCDKRKYLFALPKSEKVGCVLTVDTLPNHELRIKVQSQGIAPQKMGLTVLCCGKIEYFDSLSIQSGQTCQRIISFLKLRTGVNEIVLFDNDGQVLASRLKFINNGDYKDLSLNCTDPKEYKPYDPITLNFQVSDTLNETTECTFSLSVRDADTDVRTFYSDNVLSNLLLSSDLKGYIANPGWYFETNDVQHDEALDMLMLTQGWRRYAWKKMTGLESFVPEHPVEKGIMIDGYLKSKQNSIYPNARVSISLKGSNNLMKYGDCLADKNGYFKTIAGDFYGISELTMVAMYEHQKRTKEDSIQLLDYLFELNRHFSPRPKQKYNYYETSFPQRQYRKDDVLPDDSPYKVQKLNTVLVKAKKKKYRKLDSITPVFCLSGPEEIDELRDFLLLDDRWDRDTDPAMIRLINYACMRRGLYNMKGLIKRDLLFFSMAYQGVALGPRPDSYSYSDVDSIYIFTDLANRYRYDHQCQYNDQSDPEIIVKIKSTKKDAPTKLENGARLTKLRGYSYVSEFYSPDYKNNALPEKKDFRRTLYWNPDVKTDSTGRATVNFYNNSTCKHISISAETVTPDGVPILYQRP